MSTIPDIAGRDLRPHKPSAEQRDTVVPTGKWEFDEAVTAVFDDMLERSIPDYHGMRALTTALAVRYAAPGTAIVDLGCSRGAALKPIMDRLGDQNVYVGVEVSEPMRVAAQANLPRATILDTDLRDGYPPHRSSVTLGVLTLQFTPIEYRQRIIADVYNHLLPGGAFLFVEKLLGVDHHLDSTLVDVYLDMKGEHGYTAEQIATKRRSLEGVLVPVTADWNAHLLSRAGFSHIDCYWRHLNFGAWIAIR